jgi:hypothetical protein
LKKGTGSERPLDFVENFGLPRGACPLFRHPARQQEAVIPIRQQKSRSIPDITLPKKMSSILPQVKPPWLRFALTSLVGCVHHTALTKMARPWRDKPFRGKRSLQNVATTGGVWLIFRLAAAGYASTATPKKVPDPLSYRTTVDDS